LKHKVTAKLFDQVISKGFQVNYLLELSRSRLSNKYAFHVHVTVQASSGNVIVISLFITL